MRCSTRLVAVESAGTSGPSHRSSSPCRQSMYPRKCSLIFMMSSTVGNLKPANQRSREKFQEGNHHTLQAEHSTGSSVNNPSRDFRFLFVVNNCHWRVFTFQTEVTQSMRLVSGCVTWVHLGWEPQPVPGPKSPSATHCHPTAIQGLTPRPSNGLAQPA